MGEQLLETAWQTLNSPDWKLEKKLDNGDMVQVKTVKGKKLFKLTGYVRMSPRQLLEELFEQGSVLGLQVDGGPAEYTIRVRLGLCGNVVLEFLFSGPGGPARCPSSGVGGGEGSVALAVIAFVQNKYIHNVILH